MIAFGCATTDDSRFRGAAAKAIGAVAVGDSPLMRRVANGSFATSYEEMLRDASERDGLEAVVLLDQSVSRLHPALPARLRELLASGPEVAVIGAGGGAGAREVEAVGGAVLVLSAWAVRALRPDPRIAGALDALAIDLSLQARARGRRVVASGDLGAEVESPALAPEERRARLWATAAVCRKWRADPALLRSAVGLGLDLA